MVDQPFQERDRTTKDGRSAAIFARFLTFLESFLNYLGTSPTSGAAASTCSDAFSVFSLNYKSEPRSDFFITFLESLGVGLL